MGVEEERQAAAWRERSRVIVYATRDLFGAAHWPAVANRAYYAAYQAATSVCIQHGDSAAFPSGWNNPSHEQLPDLIRNNGDLSVAARRLVSTALIHLRAVREDADYRPGRTIDREIAMRCLRQANETLTVLGIFEEE